MTGLAELPDRQASVLLGMRWCTAFRRRENDSAMIFAECSTSLAIKAWTTARSTTPVSLLTGE